MLKPRIYTIASSNKAYPDSIHMTISLVRDVLGGSDSEEKEKIKKGVTSEYIEDLFDVYCN